MTRHPRPPHRVREPATRFQKIAFAGLLGSLTLFGVVATAAELSTHDPSGPVTPLISAAPPSTAPTKAVKPSPSKSPTRTVVQGVHPGAYCSQHGAYGRSDAGVLYRCVYVAADDRYRWRRA
jgi:hypothetical protein